MRIVFEILVEDAAALLAAAVFNFMVLGAQIADFFTVLWLLTDLIR